MTWGDFWAYVGPVGGLIALMITLVRLFWDRGTQISKSLRDERDDWKKRFEDEEKRCNKEVRAREYAEIERDNWVRRYNRLEREFERRTGELPRAHRDDLADD